MTPDLPASSHTATAFKEWQVVCDALANGRQSVLLRKGGIHEGRAGFSFAHEEFFLFPTRFHAKPGQIREGIIEVLPEWQPGDKVTITHHVRALRAVTLTDWQQVASLARWHIYSEETVRERFDWSGKGMNAGSIHVAVVEVHQLATPWEIPYETGFGGCRSWLQLPNPPLGWEEAASRVTPATPLDEVLASIPD